MIIYENNANIMENSPNILREKEYRKKELLKMKIFWQRKTSEKVLKAMCA